MPSYDVVLFDLDHTLWDYHRNADETLEELFEELLPENGVHTSGEMISVFKTINDKLWSDYHKGHISQWEIRTRRFTGFLEHYGLDIGLAEALSDAYISRGPQKTHLLPNTIEILEYLKPSYHLIILTNGFEETQRVKVKASGLEPYFSHIITSEKAGMRKPSSEIFHHALAESGLSGKRAIMIGDNEETDVQGALSAGYDAVHYNPDKRKSPVTPTYTISDLIELKSIL